MSVQFDSTPRAVADGSNLAVTLGTASLGGTIGVRLTIDDAVIGSKDVAIRHLESLMDQIAGKTWPIT